MTAWSSEYAPLQECTARSSAAMMASIVSQHNTSSLIACPPGRPAAYFILFTHSRSFPALAVRSVWHADDVGARLPEPRVELFSLR